MRLLWLLPLLVWLTQDAPVDAPVAGGLASQQPMVSERSIDLADGRWRDTRGQSGGPDLPMDGRGQRWALEFDVDRPGTARLALDWTPGPEGMLVELLLDGQRLGLPRDGWRPTPRRVVADLGSRWLGAGRHLLEVVCREQRPGRLVVHALHARPPRLDGDPVESGAEEPAAR